MKKLFYTCAIGGSILFSTPLLAQRVNSKLVPAAVVTALKSKYPNAGKITWEKEKGNYEANWGGKSGEDMSVQFTPEGSFVEQVKAISVSELPAGVLSYAHSHYKKSKISEPGKVTNAKGEISYEAEIEGKDMIFDNNGNFVKKEEE